MRRGDVIVAAVECDLAKDAHDVLVRFRITHPGCSASHSTLTGGDPGDPPEGAIESVSIRYQHRGWNGTAGYNTSPAPPDIDAWARQPEREATLFQQALDNA